MRLIKQPAAIMGGEATLGLDIDAHLTQRAARIVWRHTIGLALERKVRSTRRQIKGAHKLQNRRGRAHLA